MESQGRKLLIGDVLRRAAEATPDAPAACVGAADGGYATRTFAELEREANRLALALRTELGVGHGDRILAWAAVPGTRVYRFLESGRFCYLARVMRRTG